MLHLFNVLFLCSVSARRSNKRPSKMPLTPANKNSYTNFCDSGKHKGMMGNAFHFILKTQLANSKPNS